MNVLLSSTLFLIQRIKSYIGNFSDIKSEAYYAEFNFVDGSLKNIGSEILVNKIDLEKIASKDSDAAFLGNAWDSVNEVNVNLDIKSNAATLIELALSKYSEDSKIQTRRCKSRLYKRNHI